MVDACTGIANHANEGIRPLIYPNPSKGVFQVSVNDLKGSNFAMEVRDMQGKLIYSGISGVNNTQIDLKNAAAGVYMLKVSTDTEVAVKRLVVE